MAAETMVKFHNSKFLGDMQPGAFGAENDPIRGSAAEPHKRARAVSRTMGGLLVPFTFLTSMVMVR